MPPIDPFDIPLAGTARRLAAALSAAALGAGAAVGIGACGEEREGSVENIGGGTTGTGATTGPLTGATTGTGTDPVTEGATTTGATTAPATETTDAK